MHLSKRREKEKGIYRFTMMECIGPWSVPSHTFEIAAGSLYFVFFLWVIFIA